MNCEFIEGCQFFNGMESTAADILKAVYCQDNPSICARRQVSLAVGREQVPLDLCPNHDYRVQELIRKALADG